MPDSAFKSTDGMNFDSTPIYKADDSGAPVEMINVDALDKSVRAFWSQKENTLWLILILCSIWFMVVLL